MALFVIFNVIDLMNKQSLFKGEAHVLLKSRALSVVKAQQKFSVVLFVMQKVIHGKPIF